MFLLRFHSRGSDHHLSSDFVVDFLYFFTCSFRVEQKQFIELSLFLHSYYLITYILYIARRQDINNEYKE